MKAFLTRFFGWCHRVKWQYGSCQTVCEPRRARRNRFTGEVQFIIWHKGETQCGYTYAEDFWVNYDSSWWNRFIPDGKRN